MSLLSVGRWEDFVGLEQIMAMFPNGPTPGWQEMVLDRLGLPADKYELEKQHNLFGWRVRRKQATP
jgi:hypothetical protein